MNQLLVLAAVRQDGRACPVPSPVHLVTMATGVLKTAIVPMKAHVITLMASVHVNRDGWVLNVLNRVLLVVLGCHALVLVTVILTEQRIRDLVIILPVHAIASQASKV